MHYETERVHFILCLNEGRNQSVAKCKILRDCPRLKAWNALCTDRKASGTKGMPELHNAKPKNYGRSYREGSVCEGDRRQTFTESIAASAGLIRRRGRRPWR